MMMLVGLGCFTQLRHRESHSTLHVHSDFKELRSSYTLPRSASDGEKDAIYLDNVTSKVTTFKSQKVPLTKSAKIQIQLMDKN